MPNRFFSSLSIPLTRRCPVGWAMLWVYLAVLMPSGLGGTLHATEHLWDNLTNFAHPHHSQQPAHPHHHHHHDAHGHEHRHSPLVIGLLEQSPGGQTETVTAQGADSGNTVRLHLAPLWAGLWFTGTLGNRSGASTQRVIDPSDRPPTPPPRDLPV